MKKIFSILFALALVLSFSVVAVPAGTAGAATTLNVVPFTLAATPTATAVWTNADAKTGSYSVKLTTTDVVGHTASARMTAYTGTIDTITSLSFWYKHFTFPGKCGPRINLELLIGTQHYVARTTYAVQSLGAWKKADAINGVKNTDWDTAGTGKQIWYYGTWDGSDPSSISWVGGPITFTVLQSTLTGASVQAVAVMMGVVLDGIKAGSAYVDDLEVNGTTYYGMIQDAVDAALANDTINVAAGTYAGAIIDKEVVVDGADGGTSVITSGVPYKAPTHDLTTAFRLDAGADGTEIRDFTIQCDKSSNFYFAVFSRVVDNVIVDGLTVNDAVQGISNWGGSGWEITNNQLSDTVASGGGGIAIFLGALPVTTYPVCSDNLVEGNTMFADGTEPGYTSPGISLALDARGYNIPTDLTGSEDVSNNRIVGNTITGTGNSNEVGIEIGVIGLGDDPTKIAATMGIIHDNYVEDNTIDNSDDGLYCYVVEDITVMGNEIKNCVTSGVYIREDFTGTINFNNIHGNNCGLNSTVSTRTIDATCNWWGDTSGPNDTAGTIEVPPCTADPTNEKNADGTGNKVSDNVDYCPWLATSAAAQSTGTATGSGTATFSSDVGQVGFAGAISEASLPTAGKPNINFPHGFFSFTITGVTPGGTAIVTITLPPGPTPTQYWKYHASEGGWIQIPMAVVGPNVITITLVDGGLGDDDGDATNGIIVDQGGSGNPGPGPAPAVVGWETYPTNKVRVLLPWIALIAAVMAGGGLLVIRHRRAQS